MRHYVLPESYDGSGKIELSRDESHYLTTVLRKRAGDSFPGLDPQGNRVWLRLESAGSGRAILVVTKADAAPESAEMRAVPLKITLFQCVPKADKMDLIIRQAVEAGVDTIIPVQSRNSVPRLRGDGSEQKRQRWNRIARQAMQQCGRRTVPVIAAPAAVPEIAAIWDGMSAPGDVCLFFHEKPISPQGLHHLLSGAPQAVGICIGPEGGFSPDEVAELLKSGLQPVYINTNVLRTETAALYAIAAVQTVILEKALWNARL